MKKELDPGAFNALDHQSTERMKHWLAAHGIDWLHVKTCFEEDEVTTVVHYGKPSNLLKSEDIDPATNKVRVFEVVIESPLPDLKFFTGRAF